jgi:spore coat protein H
MTLMSLLLSPRIWGQEIMGPESLFGLDKVCDIHLVIEADEWAKLQPPEDADWNIYEAFEQMGQDAEAGKHFHSEKSTRPGLAGYLGVDHQYGRARITLGGETLHDVGLRYKGNGTFLEGREQNKYSFKVDFDEYIEDQEFRGLTKINLQNNVTDPSYLREALSYELFREAGIPCSRVGWARVKLTIPGKFEGKNLGLYSLVEQVGKRFLKDRYGSAKGLLIKPSTFSAFRHLGLDWEEYEKAYFPKTKASDEQKKKLIDFTRLVHEASAADFDQQIESYLDTDQFLRFLAVNVLLSNLDSFLGGTQNYYAYLEPESDKFQLLPWDLDHSFGSFVLIGKPESRRDLSIREPHWGENLLIDRMLAIPRYDTAYRAHLAAYLDTIFAEDKLRQQIADTASFLRPLVEETASRSSALKRFEATVADTPTGKEPHALNLFVAQRRVSVAQQLSGQSSGQELELEKMPDHRKLLGAGIPLIAALLLNLIVYICAAVAGFKGSVGWGILNLLTYPIAPMIYGIRIRKDLGRRAAIATLISSGILAVAIGNAIWMLSSL